MDATPLYAAALGWTAGMRSMTPPALVSRALDDRSGLGRLLARRHQPTRGLSTRTAATALSLAALGEMAADKLPVIPARTTAAPLLGRIGSGALVGAVLAQARRESIVPSALAGAVAAGVSSFVMMKARAQAGAALDVPDAAVAVAEDVLTLGLSAAVVQAALD